MLASSHSAHRLPPFAQREAMLLAPYAMHGMRSAGRRHPEPEHGYRGPFQRDRDRILHSSAFRRLSGKMQVFTGDHGDYHRTRLTHTMEVASVARTVGRALLLNEDLIEALALLHDLGHPPFGHAGEDTLAACLAGEGGFSHNTFALTLVEELELRYPDFPGLNLCEETLAGQRFRVDKSPPQVAAEQPLLEVQVVEAADSLTYDGHDLDDAVKLGLVHIAELDECELLRELKRRIRRAHAGLNEAMTRKALVRGLIDLQVTELIDFVRPRLVERGFRSASEARHSDFQIGLPADLREQKSELERFLYRRVYRHDDLMHVRRQAQGRIERLFSTFLARPELLDPLARDRMAVVGPRRAVGEHLAMMTDRFCDQQYALLVDRSRG